MLKICIPVVEFFEEFWIDCKTKKKMMLNSGPVDPSLKLVLMVSMVSWGVHACIPKQPSASVVDDKPQWLVSQSHTSFLSHLNKSLGAVLRP